MITIPSLNNFREPNDIDEVFQNVLPNVLDKYSQYTYHFRLYMLSEKGVRQYQNGDFNTISRDDRVILAESASTEIAIEDVTIISFGGLSPETGLGLSTKFEIQIKQPFGATFLDTIALSSSALGIKQFQTIPYFLELSFRMRDIETQESIRDDELDDLAWVWPLMFQESDIDVTSGGSTYSIKASLFGDQAYNNQGGDLRRSIEVSGRTVGDIIKRLETELNRREEEEEEVTAAAYSNQYRFEIEEKIAKLEIIPDNFDKVSNRHARLDTENDSIQITFLKNTSIVDIIDLLLASTRYFQEQIANSSDPDTGPGTRVKMVKYLYRVVGDVKLLEYDITRQDYRREFVYQIIQYETTTLISSPDEKKLDDDEERMKVYVKRGRLRKFYNYIYTGLNDQVLNFDIKFNFRFFVSLPEHGGRWADPNIIDGGRLTPDEDKARDIDEREKRSGKASKNANITPITKESPIPQPREGVATSLNGVDLVPAFSGELGGQTLPRRRTSRLEELANERPIDLAQSTTVSLDTLVQSLVRDNDDEIIGEKIFEREQKAINNGVRITVPFREDTITADRNFALEDQSTPGRTLLSSLFEQLQSPLSASLVNIEMEIKGDPYWLEPNPVSLRSGVRGVKPGSFVAREDELRAGNESVRFSTNNSTNGQTFFLFRSFTPEPFDGDSGLQTPKNNSNTVINGVYYVRSVTHTFSQGRFTQKLTAQRDPSLNINSLRFDKEGNLLVFQTRERQQAVAEQGDGDTGSAIRRRERIEEIQTPSVGVRALRTPPEFAALNYADDNPPFAGWEALSRNEKVETLKLLPYDPITNPIGIRAQETRTQPRFEGATRVGRFFRNIFGRD